MSKQSGPGGNGPAPPAKKNPFPVAVPPGEKHPSGTRVGRWIRDFFPSTPPTHKGTSAEAGKKRPAPERNAPEPVQRATVQMLPGRLQPITTSVIQQEVRFLRTASEETVVTLGWNLGEPPAHITLNHSSIQPLHARMTYRGGRWWIENLVRNDPVAVNDAALRVSGPPRPLADGDRIRIGAAVFHFFFP